MGAYKLLKLLITGTFQRSGRRDSNPRPPPWQGDVLPLNYFRICRLDDSNARPSDYKSDALPTELSRQTCKDNFISLPNR